MQVNMVNVYANFFQVPVGVNFPHFLQFQFQMLGHVPDKDFSSVPSYPDNVVLGLVYRVGRFVQLHRLPAYRRTPDLAHTPALTGGELPLN